MMRRLRRLPVASPALRSVKGIVSAEVLEERTLLTAYVVDAFDDTIALDGKLSLREAVQAASQNVAVNEAAAGQSGATFDTITFAASLAGGTIVLSGTRLDVGGALRITGLGASQLAISGNDAVQIFFVAAGANLQISNLKLIDGFGASTLETRDGGAIANEGTLALTSVVISSSTASFRGAAIHNEGSVTMIGGVIEDSTGTDAVENSSGNFSATNTIFRRNLAGAIHNWRSVSISGCLFEDNVGSSGAAIDNFGGQATVSVTRSQFLRNEGGAIKHQGLTFQIVDSSFVGNTAGSAGAIENFSGTMDISGSTFADNHATSFHGGAIRSSGTLRMSNSTVSGNDAAWNGGSFYIWTGTATFRNVTVVGNRGKITSALGEGGGFYITGSTTVVSFYNSIVAGNTFDVSNTPQDIVGVVSGSNNIIGTADAAGGFVNGTNGNIVGIDWTTVVDPVLRNNGGLTLTHALITGSAAINAGLNAAALAPNGTALVTDQRGLTRVSGGVVDIGAVEVPRSFVVDTLVDENDGDFRAGDLSLREAIETIADGGTITFASSLTGGTIVLTVGELVLDKDLTIAGLGADKLAIDASGKSRIFGIDAAVTAEISGLTLTGGNADSGAGGGINNSGTLTVTNSAITGNSAGSGGGIFNDGTLTLSASTITGNSASSGGGILNNSALRLVNSTISGNTSGGNGGGIFNNGALTVANSTFSGNLASVAGGGIYNSFRTLWLTNSTIRGNRADSDGDDSGTGGGLAGDADGVTLNNTIVAGNFRGTGLFAEDILWTSGAITAASHNLIGDAATAGGLTNGVNGNIVGVDWTTVLDPVLRDNGGPTLTHALLPGSVAIDAGSDAEAVDADGNPLAFDQRSVGFARILRGRVDIGAYELANARPVAANDSFSVNEDAVVAGSLFDDHGSGPDFDANGDAIVITTVIINGSPVAIGMQMTLASGALLTVNADGTFTFDTNNAFGALLHNQLAVQTFSYQISDNHGGTATAAVTIRVRGNNNAPVAVGDDVVVNEHQSRTVNVIANDSDGDGEMLQVTKVNGGALSAGQTIALASGAHLTLNANGTFAYRAGGAFGDLLLGETASDSFTYTVSDGFDEGMAIVTITIVGENEPPLAVADEVRVGEYEKATGNVLENDSDVDGQSLQVTKVNGRAFGVGRTIALASGARLTLKANGAFVYDPGSAFVRLRRGETASDSFTYTVSDGFVAVTATVSVTVYGGGGEADLIGYSNGEWIIGASDGDGFVRTSWITWTNPGWAQATIFRQGDFNGDGLTDVLGVLYGGLWVGISNGSTFETRRWGGWSNLDWKDVRVGDLNADGKDDVLARYRGSWWVSISTGANFATATRWAGWSDLAWEHVTVADLNMDGKQDLLGNLNGAWWATLSTGGTFGATTRWGAFPRLDWSSVGTFDINNDRRADVYAFSRGTWYVGISSGTGFHVSKWAVWRAAPWQDAIVGDFNNDGRDDLAARLGQNWWVSLTNPVGTPSAEVPWVSWQGSDWRDVRVGDFDGDGDDDIVGRSGSQWQVGLSTGASFVSSVWGEWDQTDWNLVGVGDADGPPSLPPAPPAQEASLARYWSSMDDDELAHLLSIAV